MSWFASLLKTGKVWGSIVSGDWKSIVLEGEKRKSIQKSIPSYSKCSVVEVSRLVGEFWIGSTGIYLCKPKTRVDVVVQDTCGLEEGIYGGGAYKFKTTFTEILTNSFWKRASTGDFLDRHPVSSNWFVIDEWPQVPIEWADFILHTYKSLSIGYCGFNLQMVSDNCRIWQ